MILTITPNPLLERRLTFKSVKVGSVNRSNSEVFYAGGKGINVSQQLNKLGIKNTALTFLGGHNGKLLRSVLEDESINFIAVSTKSETRYAAVTIDEEEQKLTSYFSPSSKLSAGEIDDFISKMTKAIRSSSMVVFSGSSPSPEAEIIFTKGIKIAHENDKPVFIDTYGNHLKECVELSPFAIHNNKEEIEDYFGSELNTEEDYHNLLNQLYRNNIKMAFITDGGNPVYSSKFDFHYKTVPPKVNVITSLGSGDTFVGGIIYGLDQALVYEDFLKLAISLGSLNAERFDASNIIISDAEKIIPSIKVKPFGKKMKLIDDSPNY